MIKKFALIAAVSLSAALSTVLPIHAQDNHLRHHSLYKDWKNMQERGCCNDKDCGEVEDRINGNGIEVFVEGKWCPVATWMYLKNGNAPNWDTAHACVTKLSVWNLGGPCERLICYQPKPGG